MKTRNRIFALTLAAPVLMTAACANAGASYMPITDGAHSASYESDLKACQSVAKRRSYVNGDTRNDALLGAGVGALAGLADPDTTDLGGAIGGAIFGALFGGGASMVETRGQRRDVVIACMQGRGHNVVG